MRRSGQSEALEERMREAREEMVALVRARGVSDERVLAALRSVRRHAFFPAAVEEPLLAYGDFPFPIGWGAT